jgi:hypothetical protein
VPPVALTAVASSGEVQGSEGSPGRHSHTVDAVGPVVLDAAVLRDGRPNAPTASTAPMTPDRATRTNPCRLIALPPGNAIRPLQRGPYSESA